jgi:hypothetical protein
MRPERVETLIAGGLVVELVLSSEAQREGRRPSVGRCGHRAAEQARSRRRSRGH